MFALTGSIGIKNMRLLAELSGELSGTTINVSLHLQRSLSVVLGLGPEEFTQFCGTLLKEASEAQIHALLSAEETQDALCVNPLFDSRFNDEAVEEAALKTLTEEERENLERINAKLQSFRDEHQTVKCGTHRIVVSQVEMAL
jgi:glutamine synthetase adenylyltransferase